MRRIPFNRSATPLLFAFLAVLLVSVLIVANSVGPQPARASGHPADLLMLDTTIHGTHSGGATEIQAAFALGLTVDVVNATTWAAMTAADFGAYRAIVLGDPHCQNGTSSIAAAEANRTVWGPEVTGNVVVIGTDPDFHATQGGLALTTSGVNFAVDDGPTKTGLYITLSCYYFNVPFDSPVPVPVLDQFGSFNVHGQTVPGGTSCPADSHIVATHPALAGLTDADLSNWGCSFHEGFTLPLPSDFLVLAIALDVPSTFVAADGTSGTPYIIARGVEVISDIDLSPETDVNNVGESHTLTATVLTDDPVPGTPVVGTTVTFDVIAGPHTGVTGTGTTDGSGLTTFSYTGTTVGIDTIEASFVDGSAITQRSNQVTKEWIDDGPPPPTGGGEGCTPGFWSNHTGAWVDHGTGDDYATTFGVTSSFSATLLEAAGQGGGGENALGRHAVAALLNASSPEVSYDLSVAEVIGIVVGAYGTGDFETAKDTLAEFNEQECPTNGKAEGETGKPEGSGGKGRGGR